MGSPFKVGSQNWTLNEKFKHGQSYTHEEARDIDIRQLAQRIADVHKIYIAKLDESPMMKLYELDDKRHGYVRYFFKGAGCPMELNPKAVPYGTKKDDNE